MRGCSKKTLSKPTPIKRKTVCAPLASTSPSGGAAAWCIPSAMEARIHSAGFPHAPPSPPPNPPPCSRSPPALPLADSTCVSSPSATSRLAHWGVARPSERSGLDKDLRVERTPPVLLLVLRGGAAAAATATATTATVTTTAAVSTTAAVTTTGRPAAPPRKRPPASLRPRALPFPATPSRRTPARKSEDMRWRRGGGWPGRRGSRGVLDGEGVPVVQTDIGRLGGFDLTPGGRCGGGIHVGPSGNSLGVRSFGAGDRSVGVVV